MAPKKDMSWLYDSIVGFLLSPYWTVPVNDFIDQNCVIFDLEEENKIEYTLIFKEYKELVERLLDNFCNELGLTQNQLLDTLRDALKSAKTEETIDLAKEMLGNVEAGTDFLAFKDIMVKRNLKLDEMVARQVSVPSKRIEVADAENPSQAEEEEMIKRALELSLLDGQPGPQLVGDEDELQRALRLSEEETARHQREMEDEQRQLEEAIRQSQLDSRPQPASLPGIELPSYNDAVGTTAQPKKPNDPTGTEDVKQPVVDSRVTSEPVDTSLSGPYFDGSSSNTTRVDDPTTNIEVAPAAARATARVVVLRPETGLTSNPEMRKPQQSPTATSTGSMSQWLADAREQQESTAGESSTSGNDTQLTADVEQRRSHFQQQRAQLLQRRAEERQARLKKFARTDNSGNTNNTTGAVTEGAAAAHPPVSDAGEDEDPSIAARRRLASRLRNEVINGMKKK